MAAILDRSDAFPVDLGHPDTGVGFPSHMPPLKLQLSAITMSDDRWLPEAVVDFLRVSNI